MVGCNFAYSQEEFIKQYNLIKSYLTTGKEPAKNPVASLVCGQPGSGKSCYEANLLTDNILIDTDEFRRFHPMINSLMRLDAESYAEKTQSFAGRITEKLIAELLKEKYNLAIEGTLRTTEVPVNTCEALKKSGYKVSLIVVACDACHSWESANMRAKEMVKHHQKPRLVPMDKYEYIINHITDNLRSIREKNCFDGISLVSRTGNLLNTEKEAPEKVLEGVLNIAEWNRNKDRYRKEYIDTKARIIRQKRNYHGL